MKNFGSEEYITPIYAGLIVRLTAALIDMIITAPIVWAALHISGVDLTQLASFTQVLEGVRPPESQDQKIADFLSWVISISYSIYFVTSKKQATPGKRIMNIYIATKDGQRLSVNRSFTRFFASILSVITFGIGLLMIAVTKEKTALHDIICGTRVFYGKKN